MGGETMLIRGRKALRYSPEEKHEGYMCTEFHMIDLKEEGGGEVKRNYYPELIMFGGAGKMLRAGTNLYVAGGLMERNSRTERLAVLSLSGAGEGSGWTHLSLPTKGRSFISNYAVLDTKIYCLANRRRYDSPNPNPSLGEWEFVWCPDSRNGFVGDALVSDQANARLLINQYGDLYAFYPATDDTELVGHHVNPWYDLVAVAHDVAYVLLPQEYSSLLLNAFDISKEGKGKALDVVWTTMVVHNVIIDGVVSSDIDLTYFDSPIEGFFHVANTNLFWCAAWDSVGDDTRVFFVKFQAIRDNDKIICTPLHIRSNLLLSTLNVCDFLLLQETCK